MKALFASVLILFPTVLSARDVRTLRADGTSDTYTLIESAGFFAETSGKQTPDDFMGHSSFKHISQQYDLDLRQFVFAFDIHIDYAEGGKSITDGNKGELVDRQRNEIKCMSSVPATVAADGETVRYKWKFKLPAGMKTSSEFCHVHQIKGMGSGDEVAHPVFTFTCRSSGSKQLLQIINVPFEGAPNVYLAQLDLSNLLGRWIEAEEFVTVGKHGQYRLTLIDVAAGKMLLSLNKDDIEVWRDTDDASTMRGKWGIYRSLGSNLQLKSSLQSERILFADFEAERIEAGINGIGIIESDCNLENDFIFDLWGRRVVNPSSGIYIKNGKKIIIN